jgi:hypothetical protein
LKDEFTTRRLARDRDAAAYESARDTLNARAKELLPHREAIVELLHAVAVVLEHRDGKRTNDVGLVHGASTALGVSDTRSWEILSQQVLQEATED